MQQAQDFLDESETIYALIESLTDDEFGQQTAFKGWTINNVVGHLHMWNWAADLALQDGDAFKRFLAELSSNSKDGLTAFETQWLDGLAGQALASAWRSFYLKMSERFAAADPSMRVVWAGPDMSVRSSITARLMETWAHAQEIYDLLGLVRQNTDRIRNIVVLGVNTYGWTFRNRGEDPPIPTPHLRLTAPSGEIWTYNEPSELELIDGDAEAFCQVVTQVRNIADTELRVQGPNAIEWMSKAQCFAGGPQSPPAPGTRRMKGTG